MSAGMIGLLVGGAVIVIGIVLVLWWLRRNRSSIKDALKTVAIERIDDILVPDGMGGEIHVEHLLLTVRGILIVNVKRYQGVIFASDLMDSWTAIGQSGRSTFPNPLSSLYDRVAAVKQLARDVDVAGFVVFPPEADFSKGRPADVLLPEDLLERYARLEGDEEKQVREALAPHWENIRQTVRPSSL